MLEQLSDLQLLYKIYAISVNILVWEHCDLCNIENKVAAARREQYVTPEAITTGFGMVRESLNNLEDREEKGRGRTMEDKHTLIEWKIISWSWLEQRRIVFLSDDMRSQCRQWQVRERGYERQSFHFIIYNQSTGYEDLSGTLVTGLAAELCG